LSRAVGMPASQPAKQPLSGRSSSLLWFIPNVTLERCPHRAEPSATLPADLLETMKRNPPSNGAMDVFADPVLQHPGEELLLFSVEVELFFGHQLGPLSSAFGMTGVLRLRCPPHKCLARTHEPRRLRSSAGAKAALPLRSPLSAAGVARIAEAFLEGHVDLAAVAARPAERGRGCTGRGCSSRRSKQSSRGLSQAYVLKLGRR
jgi:hypothetical protein